MCSSIDSPRINLRTLRVDLVASLLLSLLLIASTLLVGLSLIWLTSTTRPSVLPAPVFALAGETFANNSAGSQTSRTDAISNEIELVDLQSLTPAGALAAIDFVPSLAEHVANHLPTEFGPVADGGSRSNDLGNHAGSTSTPQMRWQLVFEASTSAEYSQLLDALQIELGCVGGGIDHIDYVSNFSTQIQTRQGIRSEESRVFFYWPSTDLTQQLARYESKLIGDAGIPTSGRLVFKFLPAALSERLAVLEFDNAHQSGKDLAQVHSTVFRIRLVDGRAAIIVSKQNYHATTN